LNNILFIRLRLLGDIVLTIPTIEIFKKHYPHRDIYYVAEEKFAHAAGLIPGIKEVITLPLHMSIRDHLAFRRKIKRLGIQHVIDLHSGPKSALLTWLTGAKTRIGYRTPNRNWAYTHLTPRQEPGKIIHSVYNQARLLEHLGLETSEEAIPPYPALDFKNLSVSGEIKEAAAEPPYLVIHLGAGNRFRDWGIENFHDLIKMVEAYPGKKIGIYLVGHSPAEQEKAAFLKSRCNIKDFTGNLTIPETLYLVANAGAYLGADSGPLHLASLTTTPIVGLYGPNLPGISGPWRDKDTTIIQLDMDCRPCSQRTCKYDTIRCMKNIKTDDVYEAIIRYFQ